MSEFSGWDVAIITLAAYISIVTLVRLMRHRRDEIVARYQIQIATEQRRKRIAERRERKRQSREKQTRGLAPPDASDQAAA